MADLAELSDEQLVDVAFDAILADAILLGSRHDDGGRRVLDIYEECRRRDKAYLYSRAWRLAAS